MQVPRRRLELLRDQRSKLLPYNKHIPTFDLFINVSCGCDAHSVYFIEAPRAQLTLIKLFTTHLGNELQFQASDSELGNSESNRIYGILTNFTPPPSMWHPLSIIYAQSVSLGMGLFTKFFFGTPK